MRCRARVCTALKPISRFSYPSWATKRLSRARPTTRLLNTLAFTSPGIEVLGPGTLTTVQDWPGREGYWDIGVPPSGPLDAQAFRIANRIVGNPEGAAALEMTATGRHAALCLRCADRADCARMQASIDGDSIDFWKPVQITAGSVLKLGAVEGGGQRSYLSVQGSFDLPQYMGSRATFTLGKFGGHGGRALRVGDVLRLTQSAGDAGRTRIPDSGIVPHYSAQWHSACCTARMPPRTSSPPKTSRRSSPPTGKCTTTQRTGVRLLGPKPQWARTMAARQACILRTFTTMPTPGRDRLQPATCR